MSATALPEQLSDARARVRLAPHSLLIGGRAQPAATERTFETLDPATGHAITTVAQAGPEDVDRAVRAARRALEGGWGQAAGGRAGATHQPLADLLEANADELAELESLDTGKPLKFAKAVDVAATIGHLRHFAGWPERDLRRRAGQPAGDALLHAQGAGRRMRADHPLELPPADGGLEARPALAAGCTVVLKPAEQTPLTALRLGELALEAGIPAGVLNVLTGDGETGAALVDHPGVDKIAFTGSTEVGREIGAKAGRALKRVTLELGGKSPNIILPDADLDAAVAGSFQGIYFNTGQACNAGSRLFVHRDQFDEVVGALAERRAQVAPRARAGPEHPARPGRLPGAARARPVATSSSGRDEGAELVAGGGAPPARAATATSSSRRCSRHQRRSADRPRGDLRAGAGGDALRVAGGGGRASQRHRVRPRRRRVDPRRGQRAPPRGAAQGRLGLRQLLGR